MKLLYSYFVQINNERCFWARAMGGLFCHNIINHETKLIYMNQKNNLIVNADCQFDQIIYFDNFFILIPRYEKEILIFDIESRQVIKRILLENTDAVGEFFLGAIQTKDEIILIPQSYNKILHIDKQNLQVKAGDFSYEKYIVNKLLFGIKFVSRTFPVIYQNNMYLAFYNSPHILIYDINSMKHDVYESKKIGKGNKIEFFENDTIKLLIIERLDCIKVEDNYKEIVSFLEKFLRGRHFLKAESYNSDIYLFTEDGIYVLKNGEDKVKEVDWFSEIKDKYLNRIIYEGIWDRLYDSLYVFQNEGMLFVSFELEEYKIIIRIDKNEYIIESEKMQYIDELDILLQVIEIDTYNKNSISF